MKPSALCLSLLISAVLWMSSPSDSGYYWMKHPSLGAIMVYYDSSVQTIKIWNPIKQEGGDMPVKKVPTEYKFQGPLEPCLQGSRGDQL